MDVFGWLKPEEEDEDRSLIEISNDSGDHWVADIPTDGVNATTKALRDAGVEQDNDERLSNAFGAKRIVDNRDPNQHRYRSARVIDEREDLEDSYDRENDDCDREEDRSDWEDNGDLEESEQPAEGGWFSWW
ncbi:hypothetical protein [Nodosilinea sp. P-1105]|uniref:hypothetical protein n=1 Tax=Nodosilinea sp. P-1105 TaxID=2546229 RepID=UPI00146A66F4|nr:hypothetical protein [Nodosilinea sp. P-1105]NMF84658.1 hypothetical protein [Nodosilinea sp. P-1105]